MRVLLTGATGFVGKHLANKLLENGHEIFAISRKSTGIPGVVDIKCKELIPAVIEKELMPYQFDGVVHLAAAGVEPNDRNANTLIRMNSLLPQALVNISAKCGAKAVVIVGSSAEYAATNVYEPFLENFPLETQRIYGASKAAGGILALSQGYSLGIPVAILRPFNIFGFGEASHRLLPSLINAFVREKKVALSRGTQIRDFVHIDDVCDAIISVLMQLESKGVNTSGIYNISTGKGCSVADFCRICQQVMGVNESFLNFGAMPLRPDDFPYVVGNPDLIKKVFSVEAKINLKRGIEKTIRNYKERLPKNMTGKKQ